MKDSAMKVVMAYLMVRKVVFFMARPIFYVIFFGTIFALIALPGAKSAISIATVNAVKMIPDFINWLMLGAGREQPDLMLIFVLTWPSLTVLAWWGMEWITGIRYLLKRNNLI
ncbi:hypothetical protein F3I62_18935 [Pseudomonas sp. R-28-1W-6]|uniref:hypothetical protein n=1 Tax=Pseudomonas sp. R-28-1W-6 TaxID=2650101 RepID=UPI0013660AB7|nr:hypothetical protein [Pseudomonas sp. R-28-1W-6]MWV14181.1 hypothetical protein [Pseudomonas sp. R-28-1W-6]